MDNAISPIDGRYFEKTRALAGYFSEEGLMKYRVMVECEFFIFLSELGQTGLRKMTVSEIEEIKNLYKNFNPDSYKKIKEFEATTNHDIKAVEYFIKDKLKDTSLKDAIEWVHFGLTSEDVNNCAYGLMLSLSLKDVMLPSLQKVLDILSTNAKNWANIPMLSRTHGQSASPTTLGKEFAVFASRIKKQMETLKTYSVSVKLNGATGNYNAFMAAYPNIDWLNFSERFTEHLSDTSGVKLAPNLITTQIEPHDTYAELSDNMRRINMILLDFSQDAWRYISDGYLNQKPKEGEIGSSTMPHKVNPIDFENCEGNLGLANALFNFFSNKLPVSRLQRDLSDSTVERSFGSAFAYSFLAYTSLEKGLGKITANEARITEDLMAHPEVIAEAIQTVLRREKFPIPYEALKNLTRGKEVTMEDFSKFIDSLEVKAEIKEELKKITPASYTGLASKIAGML